jgi:hypothetical protein
MEPIPTEFSATRNLYLPVPEPIPTEKAGHGTYTYRGLPIQMVKKGLKKATRNLYLPQPGTYTYRKGSRPGTYTYRHSEGCG